MWLDDMAPHHSGLSDTGYLCFERGEGEGLRGVGGRIIPRQWARSNAARMCRTHALGITDCNLPPPPNQMSLQARRGRNRYIPSNIWKCNWVTYPFSRGVILGIAKQIWWSPLTPSLSSSTSNCDADLPSGNCLAGWQQRERRGSI